SAPCLAGVDVFEAPAFSGGRRGAASRRLSLRRLNDRMFGAAAGAVEMLSADRAAELAARACSHRVDSERMREIAAGWYFPYLWAEGEEPLVGSNGIIINKQTGAAFVLGSAFPVERDLALYDKGYQDQSYDLVVLGFRSIDA